MEALGGGGLALCHLTMSFPLRPTRTPGTLAQPFTASVPRDAASHCRARGLPVPRRATEPRTPRSRAQRHPSMRDSPLQQRAPSFRLEPGMAADMGEWVRLGWPGPGGVRVAWIRKSNQPKNSRYSSGYKIYRFIVGKFEITARAGKREQKKKTHCKLSPRTCLCRTCERSSVPLCACVCVDLHTLKMEMGSYDTLMFDNLFSTKHCIMNTIKTIYL